MRVTLIFFNIPLIECIMSVMLLRVSPLDIFVFEGVRLSTSSPSDKMLMEDSTHLLKASSDTYLSDIREGGWQFNSFIPVSCIATFLCRNILFGDVMIIMQMKTTVKYSAINVSHVYMIRYLSSF